MSSHQAMIIFVVMGHVTVLAVILIAAIESWRMNRSEPAMPAGIEQKKNNGYQKG